MGVKIQIFRMVDLKFRRGGPDVMRKVGCGAVGAENIHGGLEDPLFH